MEGLRRRFLGQALFENRRRSHPPKGRGFEHQPRLCAPAAVAPAVVAGVVRERPRFNAAASPAYTPGVPVPSFPADTAFAALLDRRPEVDLAAVLAEIAADLDRRHHEFDLAAWLDEEAALLRPALAVCPSDLDRIVVLFEAIGSRHRLGQQEADYNDYRSSVVRSVVQNGRGLPIVLSILVAELGARIGLELRGVSSPGHFLLRVETDPEPMFVDAYRGGMILDTDQATAWLAQTTGYPAEMIEPSLRPASPRLIIIRVLENLKRQLLAADDWTRADRVQTRLLALRPGQRSDQFDLAAIAAHGPNPGWALATIRTLADEASPEEVARLQTIGRIARQTLIGLN